jgi:hypothetical protein
MRDHNSPDITSFVIRFVYGESGSSSDTSEIALVSYRGAIRHIQTDQEIAFTNWQEAVDFIRRFVPLELEG